MVGSLSGLVRLYSPKPSSYSPDHLILEKQLSHPVVQLESGLLLPYVLVYVCVCLSCIPYMYSGVKELLIAVLHPRAISVYKLTSKDDQPVLSLVHSHPLSHTAHSMVVGSFGRATGVCCYTTVIHHPCRLSLICRSRNGLYIVNGWAVVHC